MILYCHNNVNYYSFAIQFSIQKLTAQYLLGFTDLEVQIRYRSEQNNTK